MDAPSLQNEIEALRQEVLVLRDEKISLEGRLSFRSAQVSELEAEAADRLLEVARLSLEKDRLQDRVRELESASETGTIETPRDIHRVRKSDLAGLAARMTAMAEVVFEERHVLEVLRRSHRLLAEVLLYGVDNIGVEEIIEDEVSSYLLGSLADPFEGEEAFGRRLKAAGIAAGMREVVDQVEDSGISAAVESIESRFDRLKTIGLDLDDYQELAEQMSYYGGVVFEIEHVHEVLQRSRGLLADVLQLGVSDTVVRENILDEVATYLLGRGQFEPFSDLAAARQAFKKAGLAKGMKPLED